MSMRVRDIRATRKGADRDKTWFNFHQRNLASILANTVLAASNFLAILLLQSRVTTNEADIAANAGDIATNAGGIATNAGDIDDLERPPITTVSLAATLGETDKYVLVDAAGVTVTLPSTPSEGWRHDIKNASGGIIYVDPNGNTLEGSLGLFILYDQETASVIYDPSYGWYL